MFGMGTGIASPLWPPGIINTVGDESLTRALRLQDRTRPRHPFFYTGSGSCRERKYKNDENDNMVKPHDLLVLLG